MLILSTLDLVVQRLISDCICAGRSDNETQSGWQIQLYQ
jgi:hypothetical protein